jgi:RecA/RadA recombinase
LSEDFLENLMPKKIKKKGKKAPAVKPEDITQKYEIKGRYASAKQYAEEATKALKGRGKVVTGEDVDDIEFRHVPTGLPFFDYVTNGGLLRGGATQLWGRFKSTKTTVLAHIVRNLQKQGMTVALASIEKFSKPWWRQIGVYIPYSKDEIALLEGQEAKKAKKYNDFFVKRGYAPLSLIVHHDSVQTLELCYKAMASNRFDLIAIDSLGAVVDHSDVEDKNIADKSYGGQSAIFSKFCKKVMAAQNYAYDENNERDPVGDRPNQTMLVCINQARQTIDAAPRTTWDKKIHPVGGEALHHLWDQSIAFQGSEDIKDTVGYDGKVKPNVYAKKFDLKGTKMRGGPEQREVRYTLSLKTHDLSDRPFRAGQFDRVGSLRAIAAMLGVTTQKGAIVSFDGAKYKGKGEFEKKLYDDKKLYEKLYAAMVKKSNEDSMTVPVPEVWEYVD